MEIRSQADAVTRLKREITEATEDEIDGVLREYKIPSMGEFDKP